MASFIGPINRLVSFSETGDGRYLITLAGIARFRILGDVGPGRPYRSARIDAACLRPAM